MSTEALSKKLCRPDSYYWGEEGGEPAHWCPACKTLHVFNVNKKRHNGAQWKWDGNVDLPTFTPSMHIRIGPMPDGRIEVCHYFLTAGRINFLGDCTHALKGQTVELPDLPPPYAPRDAPR